jgi:hypothetical protein
MPDDFALFSPDKEGELRAWWNQLSERDRIIASINTAEWWSARTRELRLKYSDFRKCQSPCSHCGAEDHGLIRCPKDAEYTGLKDEPELFKEEKP